MLGNSILVAPVLSDSPQRTVMLPRGKWKNMLTGETIKGPKKIELKTKLHELPHFIKAQ
jgi:alpha-glucosidase (family GH31 glycosyl hydrolase)